MARTSRRRRRGRKEKECVSLCSDDLKSVWVLMQWMCVNGYDRRQCHVTSRHFRDTGRGLMAIKSFRPGDVIMSIPENLLITVSFVRQSYLGPVIDRWSALSNTRLTLIETLTVFLLCERRRGCRSPWHIYISTLPKHYTLPLFWTDSVLSLLPRDVRQEAVAQTSIVAESFCRVETLLNAILSEQQDVIGDAFTLDEYKSAWASVNTRCVHLSGNRFRDQSNGIDNDIALAPFLDLFNHSPDVQVEAGYDETQKSYVIRTMTGCSKYKQVFINYGPHSNKRLLLDYGFVVPTNPHDSYAFTIDELHSLVEKKNVGDIDAKLKIIKEKKLDLGLMCTEEGLSWNLKSTLLLLCSRLHQVSVMDMFLQQNISSDLENHASVLAKELLTNVLDEIPRFTDQSELQCTDTVSLQMAHTMCRIYTDILQRSLKTLY